jgi:general secretion pathway protein L
MRVVSLPESIWRIDAGPEDLTVRLVRRSMSKERVLKTITVSGSDKREQLQVLLGKSSNRGFLTLGRDQGVVRQLQLPVDVQQNLKSALMLQIEAISAWPEQEVYWDYAVDRPSDKPKWLNITIVIIPKSILDPWLHLFQSCNLPLTGATLDGLDLNVIPANLRGHSTRAQLIATCVLASALVIVGLAFLLRGPYQQRVYASQIQGEISRLEPDVKTLVREEAELNALAKRYGQLQKYWNNRDANLDALNTLATVLPQDTFIINYRYQNDTVNVSGVSASALTVQDALEKSPLFKDVQFAAPITREPSGKDRFTLTMSIEGR